ncbi:formyl transferase [Lipomyces arxii]|uniref:formyl transferase n=1 Tax=Lipomyces arxii TaxID=56418 RepID=UPI0034CEC050
MNIPFSCLKSGTSCHPITSFKTTFFRIQRNQRHFTDLSCLRILFFGSDLFSIINLKALNNSQLAKSGRIQIDVGVRSNKRAGRNYAEIREVPLANAARIKGLSVRIAETEDDFEDLSASKYDLAIAVSYGKLIPASFINSLTVGAINVHPSFLPRHAGAAPIQWTIYSRDQYTGVTIQTLHPTHFDRGSILRYSEPLHIAADDTVAVLNSKLAYIAGSLLVSTVEDIARTGELESLVIPSGENNVASRAPKVDNSHRKIDWQTHTAEQIVQMYRAFGGPLWAIGEVKLKKKNRPASRRVLLDNINFYSSSNSGVPGLVESLPDGMLVISTIEGKISVLSAKIESKPNFNLAALSSPILKSS